jgi:SPP1 family predicted phage head-tail adaptor
MNAGLMDQFIAVEKYTTTTDSNTGEKLQSWSTYSNAWARVQEAESGAESVDADRREHKQTVTFTIRFDSGVNVKDRILWDGLYFNIINIANIDRDMYQRIQTELTK